MLCNPEPAPEATTILQRSAKKYAIKGHGVACQEFLANHDQVDILGQLKDPDPGVLEQLKQPGHEYLFWSTLKNPATAVKMLGYVAFAFGWGGVSGIILFALISVFSDENLIKELWLLCFGWIASFHLIYKVCSTAVKKGWVKSKNDSQFNRRTGMVTSTWKGKRVSYPFDEFDVSVQHVVGYAGNVNYHIFLIHRYTTQFFRSPTGFWNLWEAELDWEFYQRYMDISRPLPDVPNMEPVRHNDPVSAKWDEDHRRPKDYWLNLPMEKVEAMHKASKQAAENFPWGLTREQAIASGWKPSHVGQGDWQT